MNTPLYFEDYIIEHFHIFPYELDETELKDSNKKTFLEDVEFAVEVGIKKNVKDSRLRMGLLQIEIIDKKEKKGFPYYIKIDMKGIFQISDTITEENEIEKMILYNGINILLGIARTHISDITSHYRHGQYLLPPLDLINLYKNSVTINNE